MEKFCDWLEYRWQKGNSRYYKVCLYKDLLGDWIVTKIWGGINSRLGNFEHFAFEKLEPALILIEEISQVRKKRGYNLSHKLAY
jgi:hypothetical protein